MISRLSSEQMKRIEEIYDKIEDNKKLCLPECSDCCVNDIELNYVEFTYLVNGMSEKQLRDLFSKAGKKENRCVFLNKEGKCIAYGRRPWVCRNFRRFPETGKCGSERLNKGEITDNFLAEMDITKLNNETAPEEFRNMRKTINKWYEILNKNNRS